MIVVGLLIAVVSIVGFALVGAGVLLAGVGVRTLVRAGRAWIGAIRSRKWPATTGRIMRSTIVRVPAGRSESFRPELVYVYEVSGQSYSGTRAAFGADTESASQSDAEAWVRRFPRGTAAEVFFEPGCPQRSTLDRRRPSLFGPLLVAGVCILSACILVPVGVDIVLGAFTKPPPISDSELPPMSQQLGGLLLAVGALLGLVAAIGALARRRRHRLARRLRAAPLVEVADVREGELVTVVGRAEPSKRRVAKSPLTRQAALYYRVRVVAGRQTVFEDVSHGDFRVSDGTGRLLVRTEGGADEVLPSVVPMDAAIRRWVDQSLEDGPLAAPAEFVVEQTLIAPDTSVLASGRAVRDPDTDQLTLQADPKDATSLVFSGQSRHELLRRLEQGRERTRACAVAAASALLLGVTLLVK